MRAFAVITLMAVSCGLVAVTDGALLLGAAGIIIAAKAIALGFGAGAIGGCAVSGCFNRGGFGRSRFGRSTADDNGVDMHDLLVQTSVNDADDCVKKMVCLINAKQSAILSADERAVLETFGVDDGKALDVSMASVEFDLAALIGRRAGAAQCAKIYARCPHTDKQLVEALKRL